MALLLVIVSLKAVARASRSDKRVYRIAMGVTDSIRMCVDVLRNWLGRTRLINIHQDSFAVGQFIQMARPFVATLKTILRDTINSNGRRRTQESRFPSRKAVKVAAKVARRARKVVAKGNIKVNE